MRPADLGYTMPAEWSRHAGCWMAWPQRAELWREHLEAAREDYVRVAEAIARFEPVTMIANPDQATEARRRCGPSIKVVPMPIDDSWLRDSAPTFIVDPAGKRAAAAFTFNAWGAKYHPHDKDAALGERIGALAGLPVYRSDLVVEGGGFLSDGEGTLITAETCVLNPNRNPGWSKARAEAELRAMLGVAESHLAARRRHGHRNGRACRRLCGVCQARHRAVRSGRRSRGPEVSDHGGESEGPGNRNRRAGTPLHRVADCRGAAIGRAGREGTATVAPTSTSTSPTVASSLRPTGLPRTRWCSTRCAVHTPIE